MNKLKTIHMKQYNRERTKLVQWWF